MLIVSGWCLFIYLLFNTFFFAWGGFHVNCNQLPHQLMAATVADLHVREWREPSIREQKQFKWRGGRKRRKISQLENRGCPDGNSVCKLVGSSRCYRLKYSIIFFCILIFALCSRLISKESRSIVKRFIDMRVRYTSLFLHESDEM